MADRVMPGPLAESPVTGREAVCIHTRKIFDSCREEDATPLRIARKMQVKI